ncbi:DUF1707 SHOCT-like domain-containing protein [Actinomadura parmotrematis]|uniref:DUF1707 domain-containing protein n=1 Tax=Actinomadura parmotrematis TaxID=2864039 RepID=A0ABS7FTM8_9ACTN|nr:DUF1707 domain-containing protein [Actinomadura parmotrematis]MBW8483767.1 DUF1707 domain-containing protein [Actinomadura parmotrematis]
MADDLPELRASHGDRDRAVDALRVAAGDGRLDAGELDERVERALAARTLGELAALTADLAAPDGDVLVIEQVGGKYVKDGSWQVPARIKVRTQMCRVTLDFTRAAVTSSLLRVDVEMARGRLVVVGAPGVVFDADGLNVTYSKVKLRPRGAGDPLLRVELAGSLVHAKVVERRPRR